LARAGRVAGAAMPEEPGRRTRNPSMRLAGLGVELAATVGGFVVIGLWIDWHYDCRPWGILTCMALGLVGGMYNFIRQAVRFSKEADEADQADRERQQREPDHQGNE
jgi:F0F1-type ATP synthase assembly protein I